jgi:hypothetical protein
MKKRMSEGLICIGDLLWSSMIDGLSCSVEGGMSKRLTLHGQSAGALRRRLARAAFVF